MANDINCRNDHSIFTRFYDHAKLGLSREIQEHKENFIEKAGNIGLRIFEELPQKVAKALKDPRVVTIALTALALLANSFLFYPTTTWLAVKSVITMIDIMKHLSTIKFVTYLISCETILSYGARAFGRFTNQELMAKFYANNIGQ